jgi:hypothetical protein
MQCVRCGFEKQDAFDGPCGICARNGLESTSIVQLRGFDLQSTYCFCRLADCAVNCDDYIAATGLDPDTSFACCVQSVVVVVVISFTLTSRFRDMQATTTMTVPI